LTKDRVEAYFIENMMAFAKELNVQEVTFFDAIPTGRMYSSVSSFLDLESRKKILYLTHYYRSKKRLSNYNTSICFYIPKRM
jgi:MoaA/NifB/PqqE/SkfB family radical SAM enzyme